MYNYKYPDWGAYRCSLKPSRCILMVSTPSKTCTYNKGFEIRDFKKTHSIYINYLKSDVNVKKSRWPWYLQHPFPPHGSIVLPTAQKPESDSSAELPFLTNVHLFHWMIFFWYLLSYMTGVTCLDKTRANKGTKSDPQTWPKTPFHCNLSDWEGGRIWYH